MQVTAKGKILTAESKPYDVNGNKGVSHKVRILFDTAIFPCKASEKQVTDLQKQLLKDLQCTVEFTSIKENLGIVLVSAV